MQVGIADTRRRLKEILARVAAGETVEITRRGAIVAAVVPPDTGAAVEPLGRAIEAWRAEWKVDTWPDDDPLDGVRNGSPGRGSPW